MFRLISIAAAIMSALLILGAFASGSPTDEPSVVIATVTPVAADVVLGGKAAAPDSAAAASPSAVAPSVAASPVTSAGLPAATPIPAMTSDNASAPNSGRWIDVDVTNYRVRLMEGTTVMRAIAPVAIGAQVDTGIYESTQTGLFRVYNKIAGLQYDAPYSSYISDWVGFDPDKDNGFHSFLKDAAGRVVDSGTGRISNGCIRTAEAEAIFAFAEIGMPVYVHH